jgi:serine-type D-Ala-D-Ala carboxypeptidase/endopeptidase (penicillin-binding protein 4)
MPQPTGWANNFNLGVSMSTAGNRLNRAVATIATGCILLGSAPVRAVSQSPVVCRAQLANSISAIVDRSELQRYRWGISIQTLDGVVMYDREGDKLFTPASNLKLVTTAVALKYLGSNNRLRTSIYQLPNTGTNANLLVVGRGDPTLTKTGIQTLVQQLQQKGIKQIQSIDFDDGYFRGEQINPTWQWGDLATDYAPPINGLMVDRNSTSITLTPQQAGMPLAYSWQDPTRTPWMVENQSQTTAANTSATANVSIIFGKPTLRITGRLPQNSSPQRFDIAVANPAETFTNVFRSTLDLAQITTLRTRTVSDQNYRNLPEIAAIASPPVSELIKETNLSSNNIYAEVLLKSIGRTNPQHLTTTEDTTDLGLAIVKQSLASFGIPAQSHRLADGSGLSRQNLIAPAALVKLLTGMAKTPEYKIYRDSLPIAGTSGTLRNRMKGTPAQGIVFAKTGSMTGIIGLSGYINPPQYPPLAFSIIIDRHDRSTASMSKVIDEVVVLLAKLKQC